MSARTSQAHGLASQRQGFLDFHQEQLTHGCQGDRLLALTGKSRPTFQLAKPAPAISERLIAESLGVPRERLLQQAGPLGDGDHGIAVIRNGRVEEAHGSAKCHVWIMGTESREHIDSQLDAPSPAWGHSGDGHETEMVVCGLSP